MLEAARWAPSCFNEQPWRFLVAVKDDKPGFSQMLECLMEGNQVWARHAQVLMISVAKLNFEHTGQPNRHAYHDVGLAVENLVVEATARGIAVHQMGGIHIGKIRSSYAVPEGYDPVAGIALGYGGNLQALPENLREREVQARSRKLLRDLVFAGTWESTAPCIHSVGP